MPVLSRKDIIKELGKGILFHPLKKGSLRSFRLGLTASKYAYSMGLKDRLYIDHEPKPNNPNEEQLFFKIPAKDTALVWTDESVWLINYLCGSVHSRVELASKGIGHIGTTVNPNWSGVFCIALHNLSNDEIRINVQDANEPIAYLMVHKLSSKSSDNSNIDVSARLDILTDLPNASKISDWFNHRDNRWMKDDKKLLKDNLKNSNQYKTLKLELPLDKCLYNLRNFGSNQITWGVVTAVATIVAAIATLMTVFKPTSPSSPDLTPTVAPKTQPTTTKTPAPTKVKR